MKENKKVVPFDSFLMTYKIIFWAGYFKLDKGTKMWKRILYEMYRRLALCIVVVYNLQFFIYTLQSRNNIEKMTDSLVLEIPHLNLLVKSFTMFFSDTRLQKLNEFLKDGRFCATDDGDQKILQTRVKQMHRLFRILNINTTIAACFWGLFSIVKRYIKGDYEVVQMYLPYRTDTVFRFILLLLNSVGPMLWVGNGHTCIDILIATYYAQAQTQLKIVRQQLKNLLVEIQSDGDYLNDEFRYKDLSDSSIRLRFIAVVKRYKKLTWYVKEVDSIFNIPLSFQFFSSAIGLCFVIYGMTTVRTTFQFIFMILVLIFLTTQIFLFCIFGNFVFAESQLLNDSLYKSDWLSLSPPSRRQLLIPMAMWSKPVQPTVCRILPLSLRTFLAIIKASYTLYTVLDVST